MHILLIHQAFASVDEPGGTRHHEMAQYLAAKGHQVTIIASSVSYLTGTANNKKKIPWAREESNEKGITIIRAYTYPKLHLSFFHRLIGFFSFMFSSFFIGLGTKNVDIVWGTSPPIFQGATALLLAKLKKASFLFEVRDLWPDFAIAVGILKNKLLISASRWLERLLYRKADIMVVNSPGYIDHVINNGAADVTLISNGVDSSMFNPDADGKRIRRELSLQDKFIVLYAGAHGLSNDLETILQAAKLLENDPEIHFLLVGDGKEKINLIKEAKKENIRNISFHPPIPKSDMPDMLAAANCCVAILKPIEMYKTTYPNKVFDYMAAGRPIVLAIDGVIREVVEGANAGICVTPGNAREIAETVQKFKKEPQTCSQMGAAGSAYARQYFDRKTLTDEFETLLINAKKANSQY